VKPEQPAQGIMRAITDPPGEPPVVSFRGVGQRSHRASLIATAWLTRGTVNEVRPSLPVSWPKGIKVPNGRLRLSIVTGSAPAFAEISIWSNGVDKRGVPVGTPESVVKYSRSPNPGHQLMTPQDGVTDLEVSLPQCAACHVALWASWHVPEPFWKRQGLSRPPGENHATWWLKVS